LKDAIHAPDSFIGKPDLKGRTMFVTVEVQHIIREGKEREALQVIKELYSKGLDYPVSIPSCQGMVTDETISPGLGIGDGYRDHLGKVFAQVRRVADPQASVKVRLTT